MKNTLIILILVGSFFSEAQPFQNILISDENGEALGPCEPSIAIDPSNPNRIVAGSVLSSYHYSEDGGQTWNSGKIESAYGVWGDPVSAADWEGNFYYFHLSDPTGKNWRSEEMLDRIVCQRSTDGGKTWDAESFMGSNHPKDQDKEWAIADRKTGNIYCTWTQFDKYGSKKYSLHKSNVMFSLSEDQGLSWSEAFRINEISGNCLDGDSTTEGAVPCVGPKGEIYVSWAFNESIYFDRSFDAGETWMDKDIKVADQPSGWNINVKGLNRVNGMPFIACDISKSKNKGNIYITWVDHRNGEKNPDVFVAYSENKGITWSEPIRVNDDDTDRDQFFTNIDVDPVTGYVYVVFYDRRDHSDSKTDVYLAESRDGGKSFQNFKINEKTFEIKGGAFFGDYNDISAYNGMVRPIWTVMEKRKVSVWTALIKMDKKSK